MADGRVVTGFSYPYVALYAEEGGTVSYSNGMALARGVSVSLSVEASSDNNFYANNQVSETLAGVFSSGTATLTVDGLKDAARQLIFGLPAASDGWTAFGDAQHIPYVGIGWIVRYMEEGATTYVPYVLTKALFQNPALSAATQEAEIAWLTSELTANIYRDDSSAHNWQYIGAAETTETAALAAMRAKLGIVTSG